MRIPSGFDEFARRAGKRAALHAGRTGESGQDGAKSFAKLLESQMGTAGTAVPDGTTFGLGVESKISQIVEIIRIRMMLDQHLLEFMREKGDDHSLYQRFPKWQAGLFDPFPPPTVKLNLFSKVPAGQTTEEVPAVVRIRKPSNRARQYEPIIEQASKTYGVDAGLLRAVIRAESNFRNESTSPKGAMGLMQIMPATAKDLGIQDAYDPRENIMGGARYLKSLLDRYGGDIPTALAAYNWGMGNVERSPEKLPRETRVYISRIQQFMDEGKG